MSEITGVWKLREDVTGIYIQTVYGKAGDWVDVIGDYNDIVIVRAAGGERFPVSKTNLTQDDLPAPVEDTLKKFETPAPIPTKEPGHKAAKKKAAKAPGPKPGPAVKQQDLFT